AAVFPGYRSASGRDRSRGWTVVCSGLTLPHPRIDNGEERGHERVGNQRRGLGGGSGHGGAVGGCGLPTGTCGLRARDLPARIPRLSDTHTATRPQPERDSPTPRPRLADTQTATRPVAATWVSGCAAYRRPLLPPLESMPPGPCPARHRRSSHVEPQVAGSAPDFRLP